MPPILEASAAKNSDVYRFGVGESLLPITPRGMQYLVSDLLNLTYNLTCLITAPTISVNEGLIRAVEFSVIASILCC
jgi:hypothetical protein